MNPHDIIKNPITTEKAVRLMESENKITLLVAFDATKKQIKEATEKLFNVKVTDVNTVITGYAEKKAMVKISPEKQASEVMAQLGLM